MRFTENFERAKKEALISLEIALRRGEVDEDIIPLLKKINEKPNYFTTSSCSGRISIMEMPDFGDKVNAKWLGKWHREVSLDEVLEAIRKHREGQLWLLVRSPILHVGARTLEDGIKLLNLGVSCGFKYSNIKSISDRKLIVEIRSTERLDALLGENGEILVSDDYMRKLVEIANAQVRRFKRKLKRFEERIEEL
ncbi:tRNA(Phe) 7-((3-amino-3-carboxypropyl)-4-demethylwyosine(37)-N(4))-methyltransferase Taw3 [Pyrococcus abyssi]|uniref:tRNA(Phe) 7-((3-amino-3-carboxypropyl)-4-demethylwyosine(37)-N(4))-methyltransferase 1 n=1 Tax=Pyrococcus abyssi (strain GE5 / Orsay) TaxID=272844 RepID=TYW31_PYRAB|nr:hypothetical protein [Pyrococcus abyssi]Q9V074.1 RecName: Full=tRNA(Phe) 7-((3-amino-3-carboxypropyl)-4-demethylwyosine(37)-N(4))-methyltransferase 1; AltName: Full=tRNA wyosine derivatives biosynthesis protein Taw3 1 [Pyrococcus abyssi GE5]CAB49831.1 Hypothetical protein PAB0615 [Pyrococcus abyssi GE5]CCE70325.1 TPA: hypothetical protein PAB0615 [Pyrococcus abyssi GE5]